MPVPVYCIPVVIKLPHYVASYWSLLSTDWVQSRAHVSGTTNTAYHIDINPDFRESEVVERFPPISFNKACGIREEKRRHTVLILQEQN